MSLALETLRVWEYTGRVRRGYFIEGLSGAQFIRETDFASVMLAFEQPRDDVIWMSAVDPAQLWGKELSNTGERTFLRVPGTAVALQVGMPIAVFERQGQTLRVFDPAYLPGALRIFVREYSQCRLFPSLRRLTVKQYPPEAADALANAGFSRHMLDYVLYRGYL